MNKEQVQEIIRSECKKLAEYILSESLVEKECDKLAEFLIEKNDSYGNSAIEPLHFFSKVNAGEQIKVRIDDKLNRIFYGKEFAGDDTLKDLSGYQILYEVFKTAQEIRKCK